MRKARGKRLSGIIVYTFASAIFVSCSASVWVSYTLLSPSVSLHSQRTPNRSRYMLKSSVQTPTTTYAPVDMPAPSHYVPGREW